MSVFLFIIMPGGEDGIRTSINHKLTQDWMNPADDISWKSLRKYEA